MLFVSVKNIHGHQVMINLMNVSTIEIQDGVAMMTDLGRGVTIFEINDNQPIWDLILEAREKLITDLSRTLVRFLARDYPRDHGGRL